MSRTVGRGGDEGDDPHRAATAGTHQRKNFVDEQYAAQSPEVLALKLGPYVGQGVKWSREAGGVGLLVVQFLLTIIIAAVMYSGGETAARGVRKFGARLGGQRGEDAVVLASNAIRGVALGVGSSRSSNRCSAASDSSWPASRLPAC